MYVLTVYRDEIDWPGLALELLGEFPALLSHS
jgi:hypothetical protein